MKTYSESINLPPLRLTIDDIKKLYKLITEGLDLKNVRTSFSVTLRGVELQEDTLEDLLKHEELQSFIDNLYFSVSEYSQYSSNKRISIHLQDSYASLNISSNDQAWEIGKKEQIQSFLLKKRAKARFIFSTRYFWILMIVGFFLPEILIYLKVKNTLYLFLIIIYYTLYLSYAALSLINVLSPFKIYPYSRIYLKKDISKFNKFIHNYNFWMIFLSVIAIFIGLAQLIFGIVHGNK